MSKVRSNRSAVMQASLKALADEINTLADTMSAIAKRKTPVDTGNNRDSIATESSTTSTGRPVARVFTQSGYGGWLEIGTSRMPARPYMAPAYNEAKALTTGK